MINKPKIAILLAAPDGDYVSVDARYAECVVAAGGLPVHLTPELIDDQLEAVRPRGLILPGGDFPFPSWYYDKGKSFYPGEDGPRFTAYQTMINYSLTRHRPLLGICAGMQALAGYLDGKISSPATVHRNESKYAHHVAVAPDSLLFKTVAAYSLDVNSNHNEFVTAECGRFDTAALAPDGIIEAIEPKKPWADFVLGVQWHPERLALKDEKQMAIFEAFVKASKVR
ncbi:MAG: gamma-glutamyl-gamma-aminobutyrate hydrolase family protein [Rickettsiales bacterium]|jgi:putative glutamine amidotransferase|nr:gamma-glutamyl-gamma-aminobutyrate hydrolase family protein [Rickettsiales bacterium]